MFADRLVTVLQDVESAFKNLFERIPETTRTRLGLKPRRKNHKSPQNTKIENMVQQIVRAHDSLLRSDPNGNKPVKVGELWDSEQAIFDSHVRSDRLVCLGEGLLRVETNDWKGPMAAILTALYTGHEVDILASEKQRIAQRLLPGQNWKSLAKAEFKRRTNTGDSTLDTALEACNKYSIAMAKAGPGILLVLAKGPRREYVTYSSPFHAFQLISW